MNSRRLYTTIVCQLLAMAGPILPSPAAAASQAVSIPLGISLPQGQTPSPVQLLEIGEDRGFGRLLFESDRDLGKTEAWAITLSVGSAPHIVVDSASVRSSRIGPRHFEIAYVGSGPARIGLQGKPPRLRLVSLIPLSSAITPYNIQGRIEFKYFDSETRFDSRWMSAGSSVAALETHVPSVRASRSVLRCTAFQFAPGLFLTNAHCLPDFSKPDQILDSSTLVFGIADGAAAGKARAGKLTVVAVGSGYNWASRPAEQKGLDYAVLRAADVPVEFRAAVLPLAKPEELAGGIKDAALLELFQIWTPELTGTRPGRVVDLSGTCKAVVSPVGSAATGCPEGAVRHDCNTEGGSSGAPIVMRGTGTSVVALHFRGLGMGNGNCAWPLTRIYGDAGAARQFWLSLGLQ